VVGGITTEVEAVEIALPASDATARLPSSVSVASNDVFADR